MKRAFWIAASPIVWLLHRLGFCSYKWVNVCCGARHPELFNPLWQHRWYGERIAAMPDGVNLCGIGYTVSVAEGTVTFFDYYTKARITFDRDPYDRLSDLWYISLSHVIPAPHVREAYEWVCAVFGGSFVRKAEPLAFVPSSPPSGAPEA